MNGHHVPPDELHDTLIALLRMGPTTTDDLARRLGYSANAIRERLVVLRTMGVVTRESQCIAPRGMHYIWRLCEMDGHVPPPLALDRMVRPFEEPSQVTVREYPAFNYRDPLVSALFGATQGAAS